MDDRKEIVFNDELNQEFSGDNIKAKKIDKKYNYGGKGFWWHLNHIFWDGFVAKCLGLILFRICIRQKFVNREILKPYRKTGFFIYGNHTHGIVDACLPTIMNWSRWVFTIVHPNNVSMPVLGKITPYLGALPLPNMSAAANFKEAIRFHMEKGHIISIYPEAHIWPYYTKIRPFKDSSFRYPAECDAPVFCFTNTYQKRKFGKKPKIVTYIAGPFQAPKEMEFAEKKKWLRDKCYDAMSAFTVHNNVEYIKYRREESDSTGEKK